MAETTQETPRAWLWMLGAAIAYLAGQLVGVPGVDHAALGALMAQTGLLGTFGTAAPTIPLLGVSLPTLVLIHVVLMAAGKKEARTPRLIGALVYLLISALQAGAIALWLEGLAGSGFYVDVVPDPGWGFRLKATVALTAGAALLWWLAGRVDATRRAHGALFLLLVATVAEVLGSIESTGQLVGIGAVAPFEALFALSVPFALTVAGVALALRPARYPVSLGLGFELRSPWDGLGMVLLAGTPGQVLAAAITLVRPEATTRWLDLLQDGAIVVVAVVVAFWWVLFADRGDAPRGRPWWAAALPALFALASFGALAAGVMGAGGVGRLTAPGPLEGDARMELVLGPDEPPGRFAAGDADAMVERLEALGAEAEAVEATERRIALRVRARGRDAVLDALLPRRLGLHLPGPPLDPALALPPSLERRAVGFDESAREVIEGPCEDVRAFRETLADDACAWIVEPVEDPPACQLGCFDPEPVVTSAHVASAETRVDPQLGQPVVFVELTEEGAGRMGEATRANLRRPLAIAIDGDAMSVPIIQSEIGARVQITLGGMRPPPDAEAEAEALARALAPGARISTGWILLEER